MSWLLLLVPVSVVLAYVVQAPALWVFVSGVMAIVPLAEWIRRATEQLAKRAGPAIGGLLNVTFGNMAELILGIFVLRAGHVEVVKAQITGSLIGNSLLGLGLAILIGSWGRERQTFKRERAGLLSSLLILSVIALLLPALFDYTERRVSITDPAWLDERVSLGAAVVLILVYAANLLYTLVTHADTFAIDGEGSGDGWSALLSVGVLIAATAVIALEAELVSNALEGTAARLGLSKFFLGIIVLAVVGNAAEYISAVYFARRDRMGLVMTITVGSTIQIALFTAPALVVISYFLQTPMDLVFSNPLELIAIAAAAFAVNSIAQDGETTWFEGVLLLAVYALLALAFLFVTAA
ncbi:MAG TPA: calcium/proton exchanger [Methylomirabilota bacterium]|jgi:Ca2+:H+ antiporter|nr:calcium/proton exchanger [Methylomirabilota bacterium]